MIATINQSNWIFYSILEQFEFISLLGFNVPSLSINTFGINHLGINILDRDILCITSIYILTIALIGITTALSLILFSSSSNNTSKTTNE